MVNLHPQFKAYLATAIKHSASDLHLQPETKPHIRIDNSLVAIGKDVLNKDFVRELVLSTLDETQKRFLATNLEIDYALNIPELGRFRINAYTAQGSYEAVIRVVSGSPKSIIELRLPPIVGDLAMEHSGLILVAGSTSSGKSSTLSSMVDAINKQEYKKIVTIENPVETLHTNYKSIVTQREIGLDTLSFAAALRSALRQDPDVIMVGEIRDKETAEAAIQAAQTGHLVLSTIHAGNAEEVITRMASLFPQGDRDSVKETLASIVRGVIVQKLLPDMKKKRVPALEILINTPRVTDVILGVSNESYITAMKEGQHYGMQTMDQHLIKLATDLTISVNMALNTAQNRQFVEMELKNVGVIKRQNS